MKRFLDRLPLDRLPLGRFGNRPPIVSVLRLSGIIGRLGPVRGAGISLEGLERMIVRAFSQRGVKAVALAVNSPGGSPVQSALIAKRIRQLADEKKIPVYAFAEDVAASGGYWLALAADRIYADRNSIVGSIGVISAGFGFTGLIEKLGIERRLYKQGDNKTLLDPFLPEQSDDIERLYRIQKEMHDSFKAVVKDRRGDRLAKRKDEQLFSGDIWTGARAVDLGLIDGLGDFRGVMRETFGKNVKLRVIGRREGWVMRRFGLGSPPDLGDWGAALIAALEDRALWARFGL